VDKDGRDIWDEIKFAIQYSIEAYTIGISRGDGISGAASNFAQRLGLPYDKNLQGYGTDANAVRHTVWQASITSIFGQDIAQKAGNAHEDNPNVDLSIRTFTGKGALEKADQTIDLLNNQIGQEIGKSNMGATIKKLTGMVLDIFNKDGLFTATQNKDGSVTISRTKISNEQLQQSKDKLNGLTGTGLTPDKQNEKDENERRRFEQNQKNFGAFK
jgi:hypothetical protein